MKFNEYQQKALSFTIPTSEHRTHLVLGLVEEAGEVAGKLKKAIRDNYGVIDSQRKEEIIKELGDCLWYLSALADYLGVELEEVANINLTKLHNRKLNNTLQGSGDDR